MPFFQFLLNNSRWLAGGFLLTFFSSFGQTFFISLSGGQIRAEYGLSNGDWGLLYMIATLGSALTLPYFGRIVDVISVSKTVLIVTPLLAVACMLMGFSHSIILLVLVLYCLRLFGQGMMTHISLTAMGKWYSAQRGKAVSVAVVGHQAGEAILPIIFATLVLSYGWRQTWFFAAISILLVALPVIYFLMLKERKPGEHDAEEVKTSTKDWTRKEVLKDPVFWALLAAVLAPAFIGTTLFFHQAYHIELRGWQPEIFAYTFSLMAITTFIFAFVAGFLVDQFSAKALLTWFLLPLAAACFVVWIMENQESAFLFMGLLGISYGLSATLFGALWPEIYGTKHLGAIRSIVVSLMVFGTAVGPGATGYLIDIGVSYPAQIAALGIYCIAASFAMIFVVRNLDLRMQDQ